MTLAADANDYNKCFVLTADIDLDPCLPGGRIFTTAVIAPDTNNQDLSDFNGVSFKGVFDGLGHKVSNLRIDINDPCSDFLGLFGDVNNGKIQNLYVQNISITGSNESYYIGGLAGRSYYGTISNCSSTGNIMAGDSLECIGGLIGYNSHGTITSCFSNAAVSANYDLYSLGGLCGSNYQGTITDCYSTGPVTGGSYSRQLGGLCGTNSAGSISNCHATGTVTGEYDIGGLVGENYYGGASITKCHATGSTTGYNSVGGLCGTNGAGSITLCYAAETITGKYNLGGLVGSCYAMYGYGSVTNCYATGNVNGTIDSNRVGGLIGRNDGAYWPGTIITNTYSCVLVTGRAGVPDLGGFCGYNSGTLTSCYFLNTAGLANGYGQPRTDAQMKQKTNFVNWDFNNVWAICEMTNYPRLIWQIPIADFVCPDGVSFIDYAFFAERWMHTNCAANNNCDGADFDFSGTVDIADLKIFCSYWLQEL